MRRYCVCACIDTLCVGGPGRVCVCVCVCVHRYFLCVVGAQILCVCVCVYVCV